WIGGRPSTWPSRPEVSRNADSATSACADGSCDARRCLGQIRSGEPPYYLVIVMTVKSWVDPNVSVVTSTVALPWPTAAPFGIVVLNEALPCASVVPSIVTV